MKSTIILCGGSGTRLSPITDIYPKPLVPVKYTEGIFKSNLERLIEVFNEFSDEIIVVVPLRYFSLYERIVNKIKINSIKIVENPVAESTNNLTSFKVGLDNLNLNSSGTYVVDGDTYIYNFSPKLFKEDLSVFYSKYRHNEWELILNNENKVIGFNKNSKGYCLCGISYICLNDINTIKNSEIYKADIHDYWESYVETILDQLNFINCQIPISSVAEYDDIFDLIKINGVKDTLKLIPGLTEIYDKKLDSMTNDNYLVEYHENKYIVRIPGVGSDKFTHRKAEAKIYKELKGKRITPEVIYFGNNGNLKLTKYLESCHNWDSYQERILLYKILKQIGKIHKIEDKDYPVLNPINEVDNYNKLIEEGEIKVSIPDEYYILREKWLNNLKFDLNYVVHGDLINSNILVENHSFDIYLIDFEYVSLCDFNWDLGDLLSEMSLINEDIITNDNSLIIMAEMIAIIYNKYNQLNTTKENILLWCAITHYVWSAWGYARTALGDNQLDYANKRLDQCIRCLNILKEIGE